MDVRMLARQNQGYAATNMKRERELNPKDKGINNYHTLVSSPENSPQNGPKYKGNILRH